MVKPSLNLKFMFKYITIIKIKMSTKLNKFEKVRILGQRATQISMGAPPMVDITGLTDALSIAEKELKEHKIPLTIKRTFPNGEIIEYRLKDMEY